MSDADAAANGTREKLIEAAITLMRRSGLSGAGINEIVRESGAPKGSVYYFFPKGKQQIVKEGLAQYSERVVAFIDSTLSSKRKPSEKVKALFNAFAERIELGEFRHSCPVGTVCLDLDSELEGYDSWSPPRSANMRKRLRPTSLSRIGGGRNPSRDCC